MYVSLELRGKLLDPNHVTNHLSIAPSEGFRKGDQIASKSGTAKGMRATGAWRLFSSDIGSREMPSVEEHLAALIRHLSNIEVKISTVAGVENAWLNIFVPIAVSGDFSRFEDFLIDKEVLAFVIYHGLEVSCSYDAFSELTAEQK